MKAIKEWWSGDYAGLHLAYISLTLFMVAEALSLMGVAA